MLQTRTMRAYTAAFESGIAAEGPVASDSCRVCRTAAKRQRCTSSGLMHRSNFHSITSSAATCRGQWHSEAERLRGFEVDNELKFGRLLYRHFGRFVAI